MLKQACVVSILMLYFLIIPVNAFAYDDEQVAAEFDQVAQQYIQDRNSQTHTSVDDPLMTGKGYAKSYMLLDKNYYTDVEKTNSVTSPYTGTFTYTQIVYESPRRYNTEDEAKADDTPLNEYRAVDAGSGSRTRIYAYQHGRWVLKVDQYGITH